LVGVGLEWMGNRGFSLNDVPRPSHCEQYEVTNGPQIQ